MKPLLLSLCLLAAACTTQQRRAVHSLSALGLSAAVATGKLSPGDSLAIGNGIAILTSEDDRKQKALKLASLGLTTAAERGLIKPGDAILIQEATAVITTALAPEEPALPTVLVTPSGK